MSAPPTIEGASRANVAMERGTFLSANQVDTRDAMTATAPEGMFNKAAASLEYPKPAIRVAEKVVMAPLGSELSAAVNDMSQNARSVVRVEITWDRRKRRVLTEDLLFDKMR